VLVTRPEPGTSETSLRLRELGFRPLTLPLHETVPLPVAPETDVAGIAAVAAPSASAIRHAPRSLIERLTGLPCFAVGSATAKVAREAGFGHVVEAAGDAESLADSIVGQRPDGAVAYLCGRVRRPVFQQRMAQAGIAVVAIETYDTVEISQAAGALASVLNGEPVDYALLYSANAAAVLARLARKDDVAGLFAGTTFVCISPRVARAIAGASRETTVAAEPSEQAMFGVLRARAGGAT
jgi:uroporphyrinogen-III synthase